MSRPQIGIYAGTFDPVHDGHVAFAQAALDIGLDKVLFLVEPRPRRKQGVHALEHRIEMVQRATAHNRKLGTIILEQARFTPHETIPILQKRFRGYKLCLLFGDDVISHMVDHIADWPHIAELAHNAKLIIAARKHDQDELSEKLRLLSRDFQLPFDFRFVDVSMPVSSSQIRQSIKKAQTPVGLPDDVREYIHQNNLYRLDV